MATNLAVRTDIRVEHRGPTSLRRHDRNARTHSPRQVEQIVAAMREFGWTNPILIDENNGVIAGHGRLAAALSIGMESVPVIVLAGLTDVQKRALVLADNKLALNSGWDDAMLGAELRDLAGSIDLDGIVGFTEAELAMHLPVPTFAPAADGSQPRLDRKRPTTCPHCGHEWQA